MGTIFKILALCHFLGHFGSVTSDCGSDPFKSEITFLVDMKRLTDFLATEKESPGNDSPKYYYSKDYISCSKAGDDCSKQKCCEEKTPKCNVGTMKCDCFNSTSNKFTGRPLIYLENSGKCGDRGAGCTICLDLIDTLRKLGFGQGESLRGNGSALAFSTNGNETSLKKDDFGRNVRIIEGLIFGLTQTINGVVSGVTTQVRAFIGGVVSDAKVWISELGVDLNLKQVVAKMHK